MPRGSRKKSASKKSKQSDEPDDRTGLPMSAKASRGMDALRVVANVNALEEVVRLRAELAEATEAKKALDAVREYAENFSRKYDLLVFYARHTDHERCAEIEHMYPDQCESLNSGSDFIHGYNSAMLAMARLNMALSAYNENCSPFVTPDSEPGAAFDWDAPYNEGGYYDSDADEQVDAVPSWPKKFKDMRAHAREQFPHLKTYCVPGLGYPEGVDVQE
jgi:hypothetical protein